jgi:hypothetical protein
MSLHDDLLAQAWHLAGLDKKRPKQANLRRAVSAAYYALFHLIVGNGGYVMSPAEPARLRQRVQRMFEHSAMKAVCKKFAKNDLKALPVDLGELIATPLEPELSAIANTFVEMQELRHQADYDVLATFDRYQVYELIDSVEDAFRKWSSMAGKPNANVFLAAMMLQKR